MRNEETVARIQEKLRREAGPRVIAALSDPTVIEILLNPDGSLWIENLNGNMRAEGSLDRTAALNLIATVASYHSLVINRENPVLECEFPLDGSRFEAVIPPIVEAPSFSLRKRAIRMHTLSDYVADGIMTETQAQTIQAAIKDRYSVLVVGGTASGKTTLANAMIHCAVQVSPDHRIVIIEDTREIQCHAKNYVQMRTSESKTMNDLLRATLRLRPDRIIVGEVRGGEALSLLKAWNTGHPGGIATVHANNARAGLIRLEQLVAEAASTAGNRQMSALIAEAVDLIVVISKVSGGRKITEITQVKGFDGVDYQLEGRF
ncbi:MAG: P-type conjugative transfer ATPase TrbB [Pseudobdellovibrionaceae bacterium]|nr:P-type conjugative transfer ATPase TrbB [Pseudobdellovibrionaceae bacterium]